MTAPPTVGDAASDPSGWYCFSVRPRLAEWDGVAWTGTSHAAVAGPVLPGPPGAFAFVRLPWFRWMALGQALVILPAILSGTTGFAWWSWISVVGYLAFLSGGVMVVSRFLDLDQLTGRRTLTWIGVGSGVVAFGLGFGLEVLVDHVAGWSTTLWLTGPIEEGGKLLVPVLLLVFGASRFKLPRVGLYLVLVSGATVGVLEGAEYEARPEFAWAHLQMALVRPSAELLHVFVAGFAAAVIWLAAWRRKRAVTTAGVVAFLIAAGIHSFHDGIITFFHVRPRSFNSTLAQTLREAIDRGLAGAALALVLAALLYLLARHGARELTAPGDIASCPPPWRPQIKAWGCDPPPVAVAAPGPWSVAGLYGPDGTPAPYGQVPHYGPPTPHALPACAAPPHAVCNAPAQAPSAWPPPAPAPPTPVPVPVPSIAPPGWYAVGGDPRLQGWWTGTTWTRLHRWDGNRWMRT